MIKKIIGFQLVLGCIFLNSNAQKITLDTTKLIELSEAKIEATYYNKKTTLDATEIKKLNTGKDITYLLNAMPSVVVSSDAGNNIGYSGLRLRGSDLTRINVTLNGIPVNDAESHSVYFVDLPDVAASANSISITPGVKNSKNGSSNFVGAININTIQDENQKQQLKYSVDYGSFNSLKQSLVLGSGLLHKKFNTSIRLSNIKSDGYIQRSAASLKSIQIASSYLLNESTTLKTVILKGHEITHQAWNGVAQDSLKTNRRYNELGIKADGSFYDNQIDNYKQDYYQFFFDKKINNKYKMGSAFFYTKGKGYYEEYKLDQTYANYGLPNKINGLDTFTSTDLVRQLWLDNDFYGARLFATYNTPTLDAGIYLNANHYKGKHNGIIKWASQGAPNDYNWYNLTSQKSDFNNYAMLHYRATKSLQFYIDAQLRQVFYSLNGFRNNPTIKHQLNFTFFNPKFKLIYVLNNRNNIQFVLGRAQKEPNRDDVEASKLNIPSPENLIDAELEYEYKPFDNFVFNTNLYYMNYKNQLVLTGKINDVGAYTRSNVDKSYRMGVELQMAYKYKNTLTVKGNLALSENRILDFNNYVDDYDNGVQNITNYRKSTLAFSPALIASTTVSFFPFQDGLSTNFKNASIDVISKYVSKQYLDNTQNENRIIKPFSTTDVIFQLPIALKEKELNFRFSIFNLLNMKYESNGYTYSFINGGKTETYNYYFPQAGIHFNIGATLSL
jgi:iron complex outermembrane receptor protein